MKKTKKIAVTAIFIALYFVLSVILRIPIAGHIILDLGYIALTVSAVYLGAVSTMFVGAIGVLLETALMSQRGVSPGWIVMNIIVGYLCGLVMHKAADKGKKQLIISSLIIVPISMFFGVAAKTWIDCVLYDLTLAVKLPTALAAWIADSIVMLAFGLPLSIVLRKYKLKF